MELLRVNWSLKTPMRVPDRPIHLDALLAWARVDEARAAGEADPVDRQIDLPLGVHRAQDGRGVWQASWVEVVPAAPLINVPMVRRLEYDAMAVDPLVDTGNKNKFNTGTGTYKGFNMRTPVQPLREARAWCIGEADRVRKLLDRVTHLGKLARNNWGEIDQVVVEVDQDAERNWAWRTMPSPDGEFEYAPIQASLEPPYWDRRGWQMAYEPLEDL